MIDLSLLRNNPEEVKANLSLRGFDLDISLWETLEKNRKAFQVEMENFQAEQNKIAKEIGLAQKNNESIEDLKSKATKISSDLKDAKEKFKTNKLAYEDFLLNIPNLLDPSVPSGKSEEDNELIKKVGKIPSFEFTPKDHQELGISTDGMDFEAAVKISKSRFVVFKNSIAQLNRALIQFMLNTHTNDHGYKEIYVPFIVNKDSLLGTGQLPKFKEDQFQIKDDENEMYLIPTAEVPVTNYHRDEILNSSDLTLSYVSHTPCFRSEAGSYGLDTRGIIRQHQFEKVELVKISHPDKSSQDLEQLTTDAERILELLELPYRKVKLCAGDIGFGSALTYDLEVWLPSQNKYREISSCSNYKDFQSRRLKIRTDEKGSKVLCHTLNGSGLAVGRTMAAILENFQEKSGSVKIPKVLRPFMNDQEVL